MIDNELVKEIIEKADIVQVISSYIKVIKKGKNYVAICPFHDDTNPSMQISPEKKIFKCFVCNTGGHAVSFVQKYEKISFEDAIRKVAQICGIYDQRLELISNKPKINPKVEAAYKCINDLAKFYSYSLKSSGESKSAINYLNSRNIREEEIDFYNIGYSPINGAATIDFLKAKGHSINTIEEIGVSNARIDGMTDSNAGRIIFPLASPSGQIVGFSARRIINDDSPKYRNTQETLIFNKSKTLYNYHNAKKTASHDGYVYVLEGFMDVIALKKAGIDSSVALMGVALTNEHIELLRALKCEIRLCLDGDEAGQRAMMKSINLLNKADIPFRIVNYGDDLRDPDEILQQDGPKALKQKMNNLIDSFDFQINYYSSFKKLNDPSEKRKVMNHFVPFLRNMEPGIDKENYIVKLSKVTGYETDAIRNQINKAPTRNVTPEEEDSMDAMNFEWRDYASTTSRLVGAERAIIYYMLNHKEAIEYYDKNIGNMYDKVYEEIAQYIHELSAQTKNVPDIATLIGAISYDRGQNGDELNEKISSIAFDDFHPPFSSQMMAEAANVIKEEKEKIHQKRKYKEEMVGKTDEEKALILKERSQKLWGKLKNN